jgi:hypothetical protein
MVSRHHVLQVEKVLIVKRGALAVRAENLHSGSLN